MPAPQLRWQALLQLIFSRDSAQKQTIFDNRNSPEAMDDFTATASTDGGPGMMTLVPNAAAIQVPQGGVTKVSHMLIIAYDNINVRIGSNTAPPIPLKPLPAAATSPVSSYAQAAQPALYLISGTDFATGVFLDNPSSTASAQCQIIMAGEGA